MKRTRKDLVEFMLEARQEINRMYKGESNVEPIEWLADKLISEGWVEVGKESSPEEKIFTTCLDLCSGKRQLGGEPTRAELHELIRALAEYFSTKIEDSND